MARTSLKRMTQHYDNCRRTAFLAAVLGLTLSASALAQPTGGPSGLKSPAKKGVTLYQANGLTGTIYLKAVPQINPQGEYTGDKLDFLYTMNTNMKWLVRYDLPNGHAFKGLSVSAHSQGANVSPATADSWDGATMIDTVTIKPWSLSRILQQCEQHLKKADGSYKASAVFNLQPGASERVRAQGVSIPPGAPPSNTQSASAVVFPTTRVNVYVLDVRSAQKPRSSGFSQEVNLQIRNPIPATKPTVLPRRPTDSQVPQGAAFGRPRQRVFPGATSARPLMHGRTTRIQSQYGTGSENQARQPQVVRPVRTGGQR